MSTDKVLHNFKTPIRVSSVDSQEPFKIRSFTKPGVIINNGSGVSNSLIIENKQSYYLTNDGESVIWKQPTWLETASQSPSLINTVNGIGTMPSAFRRITISQSAPTSFDGLDGDVWFIYT
jgi:hypothetical protein